MSYTVEILFKDGMIVNRASNKRPYVTDDRLHITNSVDDYTVIPIVEIKMYTVKVEKE